MRGGDSSLGVELLLPAPPVDTSEPPACYFLSKELHI